MNKRIFKVVLLCVVIFFALAFTLGILYGKESFSSSLIGEDFLKEINISSPVNIIIETSYLALSLFLTPLGIGIIMWLIYILYQGFMLGIFCYTLIKIHGISGILSTLTYTILTKIILLTLLFIILVVLIKIIHKLIKNIKNKENDTTVFIIKKCKKIFIIFLLIIINNIILIFSNDFILKLLANMT